jgi:hypothetical protein
MTTYIAKLKSVSPIIFSKMLSTKVGESAKGERESHEDYDVRVWKMKAHARPNGNLFIPGVFFKRSMEEAAQYSMEQIPGKGKSTYTKHFLAGVQCFHGLDTAFTRDDLVCVPINANADGKRGSGTRVLRHFPSIPEWQGEIEIIVADEIITQPILRKFLEQAGRLIGIGSYRPRQGGANGMFTVEDLKKA